MSRNNLHATDGPIATIKNYLPNGPEEPYNREKLKESAHRLAIALETPEETVQRVGFLSIPTTVIRIGNKLDLFRILDKSDTAMSAKDLAHAVNVDFLLLSRLLRYLMTIGTIDEAGEDSYRANNITKNLTVPQLAAGMDYCHDILGPSMMAFPSFLAKTEYRNPTESTRCPFQEGFKTEDGLFDWLSKHPDYLHNFTLWMTGQRQGRTTWLDFFPFDERLSKEFEARGNADGVILVDVGGGIGHEIEQIRNKYPQMPGKFILQDLPDTLQQALPVPGMQVMPHDFFTPQPIEGARAYYLRSILHDWPDSKCQIILSQLASAMTRGYSKILLNELVIPNRGAGLYATQLDIAMMVCCAGVERSERQWLELAGSAGLKVTKIWTVDPAIESIIELELE